VFLRNNISCIYIFFFNFLVSILIRYAQDVRLSEQRFILNDIDDPVQYRLYYIYLTRVHFNAAKNTLHG
jgi:hypothetical protein